MAIDEVLKPTQEEEKELDERVDEHLRKAEKHMLTADNSNAYWASYYGIKALYEQNKALIELLRKKS